MWLEKEDIGKMINEMGEKMIERFCQEFRNLRLEIWQRDKEWREERKEIGMKMETLEKKDKRIRNQIGRKGEGGRESGGKGERGYVGLDEATVDKMKGIGRRIE